MWLNDLFWGIRAHFWGGKLSLFGEKLSLFGEKLSLLRALSALWTNPPKNPGKG